MAPRTRWNAFFYSQWTTVILVGLLVLLGIGYGRAYYQHYQVQQEIKQLEEQANALKAKKLKTIQLLKYVESPAFVEERARLELNLGKPDETMLVIGSANKTPSRQPLLNMLEQNQPILSNQQKWWRYFFAPTPANIASPSG